ncbi:MAG: pantetheine-phosphate adenylyltransferase [Treponema sp.]|nr:pantetheine-phosphate adenylyltransferase [Treponema sp.]MCL2272292.1 pantetheine-phosphate adenylyltransferase [Treponema sp.]
MLKAAFPGSFDPPTSGHINVIQRAALIFDELTVVIAENKQKKYLFSADERAFMLSELVKDTKNIKVSVCDCLIVDYLKKLDIKILIRGVRGLEDFSYEFELSVMNRTLDPGIETIFMTTDPEYFVIRSSSIKELASFNGNLHGMVPPLVAKALKEKYITN